MKTIQKASILAFLFFTLIFYISHPFSSLVFASDPGWAIDLFSLRGGIGKNVSSAPFAPGERIILFAFVTYSGVPVQSVLVSFQVNNPQDSPFVLSTAQTNSSGFASINFTISPSFCPSTVSLWKALATASPTQETIMDVMPFYIIFLVGGFSLPTQTSNIVCTLAIQILITLVLMATAKVSKKPRSQRLPKP